MIRYSQTARGRSAPWIILSGIAGVLLWSTGMVALGAESVAAIAGNDASVEHSRMWRFVARFHAVLLHFPIGFLGLVFILEFYALVRPRAGLRRTIGITLIAGALGGIVVAVLGLMLAGEGGYDPQTLARHKWLGLLVVFLTVVAAVLHTRAFRRTAQPSLRRTYRGVLACSAIALVLAGHHGGNLTHGSQYLVKYAPGFVKNLVAESRPLESVDGDALDASTRHFVDRIRPLLEAKCVQCHGAEKQKGGYRLDERASALASGDSELPGIIPGDPMLSHLVRLILLPVDDEDVMPPRGKGTLEPAEVLDIIHWIRAGAPFLDGERPGPDTPDKAAIAGGPLDVPQATTPAKDVMSTDSTSPEPSVGGAVGFVNDIQPILEAHCVRCHGRKKRRGKLRLHTWEEVLKGGKNRGPAVVPGDPDGSPLYAVMIIPPEDDFDEELMPPEEDGGPLSGEQLALVRQWILEGASWPEGLMLEPKKAEKLVSRGRP